jgi:competence protein ComEA
MDSPKEAFYFTKDQLRIILFLVFLIVVISTGTLVYPYFKPAAEITDTTFLEKANKLAAALKEKEQYRSSYIDSTYSKEKYNSYKENNTKPETPARFDPNKIGTKEWEQLGYSPKQAESIERIKASGMVFYTAEDLKKIRIIGNEGYERLKSYVSIEEIAEKVIVEKRQYSREKIDLNTADSATFETLPMVAAYLSSRLVSYRKALGGYHSVEQIKEIKGLRESTYNLIKDKLIATPGHIKKIGINGTNASLAAHAYCTKTVLKSISEYKSAHGRIMNNAELKEAIADDELFNKLLPYISFQ